MSMVTDCALCNKRIDPCDTDLAWTRETPKGQRGTDIEEQKQLRGELDLERHRWEWGWSYMER